MPRHEIQRRPHERKAQCIGWGPAIFRSVHADDARNVTNLGNWNRRPKLNWNWDDKPNDNYGSGSAGLSRLQCSAQSERCYIALRQPPSIRPIFWSDS